MCDFRAYLGYATVRETEERIDIPNRGMAFAVRKHMEQGYLKDWYRLGFDPPVYQEDSPLAGLYMVCATGSFYAYYDGNEWQDCYNNSTLDFAFSEGGSCMEPSDHPDEVPRTRPDGTEFP